MKTMLITGASTGVGRASALHFAGAGYTICALARNEGKLRSLQHEKTDGMIRNLPIMDTVG